MRLMILAIFLLVPILEILATAAEDTEGISDQQCGM